MNDKFIDALMNPTRQRILEYLLLKRTATVNEMSEVLSDIPRPSIYRHIKIMLDSGLIEVKSEKQVRGTVEKTYILASALVNGTSEDDIPLVTTRVLFSVLGSFSRYFARADADPQKDMLSISLSTLMLSDEEFTELLAKVGGLINANIANKPDAKRKPRNILFSSVPTDENKGE